MTSSETPQYFQIPEGVATIGVAACGASGEHGSCLDSLDNLIRNAQGGKGGDNSFRNSVWAELNWKMG